MAQASQEFLDPERREEVEEGLVDDLRLLEVDQVPRLLDQQEPGAGDPGGQVRPTSGPVTASSSPVMTRVGTLMEPSTSVVSARAAMPRWAPAMAWGVCSRIRPVTLETTSGRCSRLVSPSSLGSITSGTKSTPSASTRSAIFSRSSLAWSLSAVALVSSRSKPADPVGVAAHEGQGYIAPEGQPAEHHPVEPPVVEEPSRSSASRSIPASSTTWSLAAPNPAGRGRSPGSSGQGLDLGRPHAPVEWEGVQQDQRGPGAAGRGRRGRVGLRGSRPAARLVRWSASSGRQGHPAPGTGGEAPAGEGGAWRPRVEDLQQAAGNPDQDPVGPEHGAGEVGGDVRAAIASSPTMALNGRVPWLAGSASWRRVGRRIPATSSGLATSRARPSQTPTTGSTSKSDTAR